MEQNKITREFKLTTISLKNKSTVFLIAIVLAIFGVVSYNTMPKELFPEVVFPRVFINTIYPGNSPIYIENLVTVPLEREIKSIKGIKNLESTSSQDNSNILIEFSTNVDFKKAVQDVKDAVDKAKKELPDDLPFDPIVMELDVTEFPIININLSGDYNEDELRKYAEYLEKEIETIDEISKVDITGINEKEIKIDVDLHKLTAYQLNFFDIENSVKYENITISGGEIITDKARLSVSVSGEFNNIGQIKNIVVKHVKGNAVYLKDIAEVIDGYESPKSFARLDGKPVVSLQVIKKSGENILNAVDKIYSIIENVRENKIVPEKLKITVTNDQSDKIRRDLKNLENSMITGIILIILVLYFFIGLKNALFVGISIPMSLFISFIVLNVIGFSINNVVLFSLIISLGILVDNAIVVVENIYRFVKQGYSFFYAAKQAVGEVAMPIIVSTVTTLAAFLPFVFWEGTIGEFMKYLPITLIAVLTSSLFVALVIIPVISSKFNIEKEKAKKKKSLVIAGSLITISISLYFVKSTSLAIFLMIIVAICILNILIFSRTAQWFQNVFLIKLENFYLKLIEYSLKGIKPYLFLSGTFLLLFLVLLILNYRNPNIVYIADVEPSYVNIIAEMPGESNIYATDSLIQKVEKQVVEILEPNIRLVQSILTTVGKGSGGYDDFVLEGATGDTPHKGAITVSFVDYIERKDVSTNEIIKQLSNRLTGKYPGVRLSFDKEEMGPPAGKPINIEISGKDFDLLMAISDSIKRIIDNSKIIGIEGLRLSLDLDKPELSINIDRDKAQRYGLSTAQIAGTIRTALLGKKISDYKVGEDEYPIQLRLAEKYRNNITSLLNQKITFLNRSTGQLIQMPVSAVADVEYNTTYGSIKRKNAKRVITLYSNVLEGYNSNNINTELEKLLEDHNMPNGYEYKFTGEQEEQDESMQFLIIALLMAMAAILIILVAQFNSFSKPIIILTSIIFSTIGVFGGITLFNMDISVVMTGIGIIALAGIVVNNAIVLIDYIDILKQNKKKELELHVNELLPINASIECIIQGGKTRLRPVLLTAITTILGILPLAIGFNINFSTLLAELNPQIYFGGDNAAFWGPMAWTIIFGLTFATFLTLVIIPVMYLITDLIYGRLFKKA